MPSRIPTTALAVHSLPAQRPDLLHVFTPDTGAAMMIRAGHELGIPVLYHEMGTAHHLPMLEDYYRRLEKVLPLCTEVAALSPRLAEEWSTDFRSCVQFQFCH